MTNKLTPEQELEADSLFAEWRNAANAAHEAKTVHGDASPEYGRAVTAEGEIWSRYLQLRPAGQKNWR
jgi:hypothetical protein